MKRLVAIGTVVVLALAAAGLVLAQSDPVIGTWKLNLAKSKFDPGPPPKSQMRTYEAQGDAVKLSVEGTAADGSTVAYGYIASEDGKDYPITGSGVPSGADSVAVKRINANAVELTLKKDGKAIETARRVVSKDGKLLTINVKGTNAKGQPFNNVVVFDKQ
ncbi:MAG: hypothetical protein WBC04_06955 [Candidatus Acidiferrales bacterium]